MWTELTIASYLRAAHAYLQPKDRWIQDKLRAGSKAKPAVCAVGAIYQVTSAGDVALRHELIHRLYDQLPRLNRLTDSSRYAAIMRDCVAGYNDQYRRKKEEVLFLFARAADVAELQADIADLARPHRLKASLSLDAPVKVKR